MPKIHSMNHLDELERHCHDGYPNLGYDYENKGILKNVVSQEIFGNPLNDSNMHQLERLVVFLVNQVKRIKLQYSFALDKDSKLLN